MKSPRYFVAVLMLAICAQPVVADRDRGGKGAGGKSERSQARGISSAQAAEIARKRTGGRVLAVKPAAKGYRVKVLTPAGEVRYVKVSGP